MTKEQALMMLVGGLVAISASTLPSLFMGIAQLKKIFDTKEDDYSFVIGLFWMYVVQLLATMLTLIGFYTFDLFNKGAKYTFLGGDGVITLFWNLQQGAITSETATEIASVISTCIITREIFLMVNALMPLIVSLIGFLGGFLGSYQTAKRNGSGMGFPLVYGAIGSFVAYVVYVMYAETVKYSLYLESKSLIDMAHEWWK